MRSPDGGRLAGVQVPRRRRDAPREVDDAPHGGPMLFAEWLHLEQLRLGQQRREWIVEIVSQGDGRVAERELVADASQLASRRIERRFAR